MDSALWQIIITKAKVYLDRHLPAREGQSSFCVIYWCCFKHHKCFNSNITCNYAAVTVQAFPIDPQHVSIYLELRLRERQVQIKNKKTEFFDKL